MSRETDSSSSGPQGRGGAAYPSGTPPYGTRPFPSLHPQERPRQDGAPDAPVAPEPPVADEPKTETTLTTRIRINIPGSRPIPPVVMRTPVDENNPAPPPPAPEPEPVVEARAEPEPEPEPEKTSDWFAPRKSPPAAPSAPAAPAPPAPGGGSDARTGSNPYPPGAAAPGTASTPYLPPPVGAPLDGGPAARGPHDTPAGGFPSPFEPEQPPPFGVDAFPPGVPRPTGTFPGPDPYAPDPYATERQGPGQNPNQNQDLDPLGIPYGAQAAAAPYAPPAGQGAPPEDGPNSPFPNYQPPVGPTSGPVTGPMQVPPMTEPRGPVGPAGFRPPAPSGSRPPAPGSEDTSSGFRPPVPPVSGFGADSESTGSGFRPSVAPADPNGRVSDDTLVSGIPTVLPEPRTPRPAPAPAPAPRSAQPKKKGRSKVALLGVSVGTVAVLAYGTGLLMDHGDVPKGTTVLGVDIGNKNKDDAVKMLNTALGNRTTAPLNLTIGDRKQTLKPSVAGLSIDTDATVRGVAHSDYNPVSVIGSLFGGSRTGDPVVVVDEDKLKVALKSLAGRSGAGSDGMVRFADGKAIGVPGKTGQSFDVDSAATQVAAAYRTRAETGGNPTIALQVSATPPKVTQAELDTAVNGFGKHAMSGIVTVRAGGRFIKFGPQKSLPKFLSVVPDGTGKLQPHIDLAVLKGLYGRTFDGVLLKRSDGSKTAVTPEDVAVALVPALDATGAKRDVTLPHAVG